MTAVATNPNTGKPVGEGYACIYTWMLPKIVALGFEHGYAVAVHGSMRRDLDLVAVPWIQDAKPAADLVAAICERFDAHCRNADGAKSMEPTAKPHGRLAWSIHFGGGPYIDLSIVPTQLPGKAWHDLREAVTDAVYGGDLPIKEPSPLAKVESALIALKHSEITPGRPH